MPYEFRFTRRVEFAETDMGGIVHFANYFRYMEATEHAFYRSLGLRIHTGGPSGIGWPRISVSCDFKAPLRFDDEVEAHLLVEEKRTKSVTYRIRLRKLDGGRATEVACGTVTVVTARMDPVARSMEAVPLPSEFVERIEVAPAHLLAGDDGTAGDIADAD